MSGWDFPAAWLALRGRDPRLATPRIERSVPLRRSLKPLLWSALKIALVGVAVLILAIAGETAHDQLLDPAHPRSNTVVEALFTFPVWLKLATELGYACLIAAVVSFFIEATARREQTVLFEEAMSDIGASVLKGVYRLEHDRRYVEAVVNTCLAVRLVRENTEITYTISEFTDAECAELKIRRETFVRVDAHLTYDARNIGTRDEQFEAAYNIPVRRGGVAAFAKVTLIEIKPKSADKTTQFNEREAAALLLPADHQGSEGNRAYRFPLPVKAGDTTRVSITARYAKERSDNENFGFLLPTLGARLHFLFNVAGLEIGANANMAADLPARKEIIPGKHVKWDIEGPLVPFNNVTIWWRTSSDSGMAIDPVAVPAIGAVAGSPPAIDPLQSAPASITPASRKSGPIAAWWSKIAGH